MLPTRWDPWNMWSEMNRLREEMDRHFGRRGGDGGRLRPQVLDPPLNLWEDDNQLFVEAELPGFELDDLEITVTGENQLSLKGERKRPELTGGTWHRQERSFGGVSRLIELPAPVDPNRVQAELKHGVLTIVMPKREEAKARRIQVLSN